MTNKTKAFIAFIVILSCTAIIEAEFLTHIVRVERFAEWLQWVISFVVVIPVTVGAYELSLRIERKYFR